MPVLPGGGGGGSGPTSVRGEEVVLAPSFTRLEELSALGGGGVDALPPMRRRKSAATAGGATNAFGTGAMVLRYPFLAQTGTGPATGGGTTGGVSFTTLHRGRHLRADAAGDTSVATATRSESWPAQPSMVGTLLQTSKAASSSVPVEEDVAAVALMQSRPFAIHMPPISLLQSRWFLFDDDVELSRAAAGKLFSSLVGSFAAVEQQAALGNVPVAFRELAAAEQRWVKDP